jgi:hypothetical protein
MQLLAGPLSERHGHQCVSACHRFGDLFMERRGSLPLCAVFEGIYLTYKSLHGAIIGLYLGEPA